MKIRHANNRAVQLNAHRKKAKHEGNLKFVTANIAMVKKAITHYWAMRD